MLQVQAEAGQAGAGPERRPEHLVEGDDEGAAEGDAHRMGVEQGDAGEDAGEQDELDRRHEGLWLHRGSRQADCWRRPVYGRPGRTLLPGRRRSA